MPDAGWTHAWRTHSAPAFPAPDFGRTVIIASLRPPSRAVLDYTLERRACTFWRRIIRGYRAEGQGRMAGGEARQRCTACGRLTYM